MKDHNVIIKAAVRLLVSVASSSLLVFQAVAQNAPLPLIEATPPIQLNPNLGTNQNVTDFKISPDNEHVVYIADQNNDEVFELYSAKMDGSTPPVKLSIANPVTEGDVLNIAGFSEDGERVLYSADQVTDEVDEIFSIKLDGTSRLRVTPTASGPVNLITMTVLPEDNRILYVARTGSSFSPSDDLFSVMLDGSSLQRLTDNFPVSAARSLQDLRFSKDGSKVAYGVRVNDDRMLYVASTNGSETALRVDGNGNGQDLIADYSISNDNAHVVYLANQDSTNNFELYSAPTSGAGGAAIKLNLTLPPSVNVREYRINTLNSSFVYYIAEQFEEKREEVFSVPISGGTPSRLSPEVEQESDASFTSRRGDILSYRFIDRAPSPDLLTLRGISQATNTPILISERTALVDFSVIQESNSGRHITFIVREAGISLRTLFSLTTRANATNDRTLISEKMSNIFSNYVRSISSDDRVVVYATDNFDVADTQNLFATSLTRGQPTRITPDLPSGSQITDAQISNNTMHVVYRADQSTVGQFNLYSSTLTINEPVDDSLCVPIKTSSGGTAVVCL